MNNVDHAVSLLYELAFFAFLVFTGISSSSVLGTKPNFAFVLVDEWEYADVSFQQNPQL